MDTLIWLLLAIVIVAVVIWILDQLPFPPPFRMIARVLVALIFLLALVDRVGIYHFR